MGKYNPTQDELRQFYDQNNKTIIQRPKSHSRRGNGQLVYQSGVYVKVVRDDAPYALLQKIKRDMINKGYNKNYLKIRKL